MWETLFIWTIIAVCAFYVGRKFFRQWRRALDPHAGVSCDCSCSGCGTTSCDSKKGPV